MLKVGDRVRVVKPIDGWGDIPLGTVGVVVAALEDGYLDVDFGRDDDSAVCSPDEIKLDTHSLFRRNP